MQVGDLGQILLGRIVEADAALLDELHERERRDRLGHRGDAEQRIGGERTAGGDVRHAERALIKHALAVGDERHDARHILALDRRPQAGVNRRPGALVLRECFAGRSPQRHPQCSRHNDPSIHDCLPIYN